MNGRKAGGGEIEKKESTYEKDCKSVEIREGGGIS